MPTQNYIYISELNFITIASPPPQPFIGNLEPFGRTKPLQILSFFNNTS